ncbi:hypothetical protein [Microbacterium sp.]|uniref:hypothetical protein n=1 Tax=Microbacterium sp. TaxID=51671 RepID=UPI0039E3901D
MTPELVERAWAMYRIGVRIPFGQDGVDLRLLDDHLPRMGRLHVEAGDKDGVTGYAALFRARSLEYLEIDRETDEEADLSRLFNLCRYVGPSHGRWATVLAGGRLEHAEVREVTVPISAPLHTLHIDGPRATRLPDLAHPEALRALTVITNKEFDLTSVRDAEWLQDLRVYGGSIGGLNALSKMRKLTRVVIDGRVTEDPLVLGEIDAPDVYLVLKPRPRQELVDVAVQRGWRIEVPWTQLRQTHRRLGIPLTEEEEEKADVRWFENSVEVLVSADETIVTFTAYEQDLPPGMSGTTAEEMLLSPLRERWGDVVVDLFQRASTPSRMILTAPAASITPDVFADITRTADELFSGHYGGV